MCQAVHLKSLCLSLSPPLSLSGFREIKSTQYADSDQLILLLVSDMERTWLIQISNPNPVVPTEMFTSFAFLNILYIYYYHQ
jgi:hypothetical protein